MNIKFTLVLILVTIIPIILTGKRDIIVERAEKLYIDTNYGDFNVSVFRLNRSDTAITVYIQFYQDVCPIAHVDIQLYALYSNQYKLMPVTLSKSVCEFMNNEWQWVADEVSKVSNVPKSCPVPPGDYYVKNFVLDSKKIPDMPWDKIMVYVNITLGEEKHLVATAKIYVRYDRDGMFLRKLGLGG